MRTIYDPGLRAQITYDDENRVRNITHMEPQGTTSTGENESLALDEGTPVTPRDVATAYVERMASLLHVPSEQLESMSESASHIQPQERPVQYRVAQEKTMFDATTVGFAQTVHEVPVWESGISVTVKHGPYRVVSADDNTADTQPDPKLPPEDVIARYQELFATADAEQKLRETAKTFGDAAPAVAESAEAAPRTAAVARDIFRTDGDLYVIRGRFFIYRYVPEERLPPYAENSEVADESPAAIPFDLPPVPDSIVPGQYYMVAELTVSYEQLVWQALVELETQAVLRLRPMFASVNALVFRVDPLTATGVATHTSNQPGTILDGLRERVVLANLTAPANGTQALRGARAAVVNVHAPNIAAPTKPAGEDFDFAVRTNEFAAVNAYYHAEQFFQTLESLGFPLNQYFNNTTFPVAVDHRAEGTPANPNGHVINAHCGSNGTGGIGHVCFALNDLTDTTNPIGRACDSRVFWHELGGHGVLFEFINDGLFKFAHSAGDSVSAIFHAPDSNAPDPRRYAPWHPVNQRRNDREVADGWAWGGSQDKGLQDMGYQCEEILATTMFRMYLAIGGASDDLARRRFASRMMLYLIFRTIGTLDPVRNPPDPLGFANAMIAAELLNWTTEGVFGGAYGKVIRWTFEKQGLYQPPGTPRPIMTAGLPPDVDVYIDDGERHGEYGFVADHAGNPSVWNRLAADDGTTHEEPRLGATNHAYVRIKNRGPNAATGVRVRAFHSRDGAGLVWPNDFQPMTTAAIEVGLLDGNNAEEKIVGPFAWTPVANASGCDAMLMIASATEDPSNADHFAANESIEDWRLVPNDNGIAQRNVRPS